MAGKNILTKREASKIKSGSANGLSALNIRPRKHVDGLEGLSVYQRGSIVLMVGRGRDVEEVAKEFGVSVDVVEGLVRESAKAPPRIIETGKGFQTI